MNTLIRAKILLVLTTFIVGVIGAVSGLHAGGLEKTAQQDQNSESSGFKIKVDVDLVAVEASVFGKPTAPLKEENFIIYDNDAPQSVSYVSRDQFPLAIALMVDRSPSIGEYLPMLQFASLSALRFLKPEDEVVLYSFDVLRQRLTDLTRDRTRIINELGNIKVSNRIGTIMYDAIADAAQYLKKEAPNSQHAIILFSDNYHYVFDGAGYGSGGYSAESARVKALEGAATVYSIRTPGADGKFTESESNEKINWIANETGGQQLKLTGINSVKSALENVIANLRMQYTLWFSPSQTGEKGSFHKLAVKLANPELCPNCKLLTRAGYYSGMAAPSPSLKSLPASTQEAQKNIDESLVKRSVVAVAKANLELQDIPFQVATTGKKSDKGESEIKVDLQIDIAGIAFKEAEGKHACKIRVVIFYADEKGKILGADWRAIEGALSEETYIRAKKTGISFSATVPVKAENQILKIVVYDEGSDKVGSKLIRNALATATVKSGS